MSSAQLPQSCSNRPGQAACLFAAVCVPLFYLVFYCPYGMDTTDFGYFYGYAWRILKGQAPYRDFFYIKPAFPLYWHAFWLWLSPENWQILLGKIGFMLEMLGVAWFGALYLKRLFSFTLVGLPVTLLATTGFIFGIHTFPYTPWHTADGALFSALALFCSVSNHFLLSGIFCALAFLCKQSFLLLPAALFLMLIFLKKWQPPFLFLTGFSVILGAWFLWLGHIQVMRRFMEMTTGQLSLSEALEAGILIYIRQNLLLPFLAFIPWLTAKLLKIKLPSYLLPCYCYIILLGFAYIHQVFTEQKWIGFGLSWPTFFLVTGVVEVFLPQYFLKEFLAPEYRKSRFHGAEAAGAGLLAAWSCAISGGYKIPAFMAVIPLFYFFLLHKKMGGNPAILAGLTLITGFVMFGAGQTWPYVFPERPLKRSEMIYDAGSIYPRASHVYVDRKMREKLAELKKLREEFGENYRTMPGFTIASFLNDDIPKGLSEWYIDWEINGKIEEACQDLIDNGTIIFMERDQADTARADHYERAGYGVPQKIRKNWKIIKETPNFIVFSPPESKNANSGE